MSDAYLTEETAAPFSKIGRNFAFLTLARIITFLLNFATTVYLTRTLEADGFGIITFALGVYAYSEILVDFGFTPLGQRETARAKLEASELVLHIILARLLLLLPTTIALVAFINFVPMSNLQQMAVILYAFAFAGVALDITWLFLGKSWTAPIAIIEALSQLAITIGIFLLVRSPDQILWVPILFVLVKVIGSGLLIAIFWRAFGQLKLRINRPLFSRLFKMALPFAGSKSASLTLQNFDIIIIGIMLTATDNGHYGAAYRLTWLPAVFLLTYNQSILPVIAGAFSRGIASIEDFLQQSLRLSIAIGLGITVGGILTAEPLVLLVFGREYQNAGLLFQVLLPGTFMMNVLFLHYRIILSAWDLQWLDLRNIVIASVSNVALNIVLIPSMGTLGAAIATFIAHLILLILSYHATAYRVHVVPFLKYLPRPILAALVMALVLVVMQDWHVIGQVIVGGLVYVGMLGLLRVITMSDIQFLLPKSRIVTKGQV